MSKSRRKHRKHQRPAPPPPRRGRFPWILAIAGTLIIAAVALGLWRAWPAPAPALDPVPGGTASLLVTPTSIDLGDVPINQWTSASVKVRNVGTGTLRFEAPPWVSVVEGC